MPTLTFQLANPRIGLKAKEDSDEWSLSFDATIELPEYDHDVGPEAFDVICDGKRYDGFTLAGRVRIGLHPSPDRPDGEDEKDELRTKLGYIRIDEFGENNPPNFLIDTSLSPNAFFHLLQANLENCRISLFIQTISMWDKDQQGKIRQEVGLVCTAPDGTEYEWDTTTRSTNCLSYVSLTITPRSEGASVLGPSQEVISQAPPSPISGAVDTSKLIRAVNRLLWAVVIIGLLVVLRAS